MATTTPGLTTTVIPSTTTCWKINSRTLLQPVLPAPQRRTPKIRNEESILNLWGQYFDNELLCIKNIEINLVAGEIIQTGRRLSTTERDRKVINTPCSVLLPCDYFFIFFFNVSFFFLSLFLGIIMFKSLFNLCPVFWLAEPVTNAEKRTRFTLAYWRIKQASSFRFLDYCVVVLLSLFINVCKDMF